MQVNPEQRVKERLSGKEPVLEGPAPGDVLAITPLGGVGEIGKNLTVIECQGSALVIDCGLRFPNAAEHPGIDLIIPDFSHLRALEGRIAGLVLTHGHEDHIGALAFLLREQPLDVYGTAFALGLARGRLQEMGVLQRAKFHEIEAGRSFGLGPFKIEPFHVCHSIVEGVGLAIQTPLGLVVHSGDFKFDADPIDGRKMEHGVLGRLGERGVLALISDSTNIERPGHTPGEREVRPALDNAFARARRRVLVTCFASNVHRFQQVLEAAAASGRKLATLGRSMNGNMKLALEQGLLQVPKGVWIDFDELRRLDPAKTAVVCTGSQGEARSGLARMADGTHTDIKVEDGDLLVYSARAIPGNERIVGHLINNFYRRGAEVLTERAEKVHVSGHASREDLRDLLRLLKPRYYLPAHGELRHQVAQRGLAFEEGIPRERVFELENGQRWSFDGHSARADLFVTAGEVLVDGLSVGDEEAELVLRERHHLREDGLVVCSVGLSSRDGEIINGPYLLARGLMAQDLDALLDSATAQVQSALGELAAYGEPPDWDQAREVVVATLKKFFKKKLQARPVIIPAVLAI